MDEEAQLAPEPDRSWPESGLEPGFASESELGPEFEQEFQPELQLERQFEPEPRSELSRLDAGAGSFGSEEGVTIEAGLVLESGQLASEGAQAASESPVAPEGGRADFESGFGAPESVLGADGEARLAYGEGLGIGEERDFGEEPELNKAPDFKEQPEFEEEGSLAGFSGSPEAAISDPEVLSLGEALPDLDEAFPDLGEAFADSGQTQPAGQAQAAPGAALRPDLKFILEGLIFVADEPMTLERLKEAFEEDISESDLETALEEMAADWEKLGRAFIPRKVAGGWQFRSKSSIAPYAVRLKGRGPSKRSKAAMEALAVIAYRQPVLRTEVEKIRGVDSGGVLKSLLEKNLIRISGRKDSLPGRPLLYSTTAKFLETFDLPDLKSLPSIEEIERLCPPRNRLF